MPTSDRGATIDVRIELEAAAPGDGESTSLPRRLELSVTDDGVGIADETKTTLFQPFAQAQRSTGGTPCVNPMPYLP